MNPNRPYLIIPKLIEQPTWGGSYITNLKGWQDSPSLSNKKIGQSYELFSGTKLAISITSTSDPRFVPEVGNPDNDEVDLNNFKLIEGSDYININVPDLLLIKINHSKGNSFQLHIKHNVADAKWKPKSESWYYLEDGKLTFGVNDGVDLDEYKKICIEVDMYMQDLSQQVKSEQLDIVTARHNAKEFVATHDPHRFVNMHYVKKYEIVDPSLGGIHHSWEEDNQKLPIGNVVFEIQEDVMDPVSTIRAFDQGKIKDNGEVRNLNIDDYFKYLDTDKGNNNIDRNRILSNSIYGMDVLEIQESINLIAESSYHHLYVRDGSVDVVSDGYVFKIGRGHSAFIPKGLSYRINSTSLNSVVLKTYSTK